MSGQPLQQPVFALDSSGKTACVCVMDSNRNIWFEKGIDEGLKHSQTLLPLADEAFKACGLKAKEVGVYAITVGPGSFTGLRIGLALVKGLALPFGTLVAAVSTLHALALGAACPAEEGTVIIPALDARRGEVYWAAFGFENGQLVRLTEDAADKAEKIEENLEKIAKKYIFFIGDGAEMCYNAFGNGEKEQKKAVLPLPNIACGAALAALQMQSKNQLLPSDAVRPSYLRLSQAERERAQKQKEGSDPTIV